MNTKDQITTIKPTDIMPDISKIEFVVDSLTPDQHVKPLTDRIAVLLKKYGINNG